MDDTVSTYTSFEILVDGNHRETVFSTVDAWESYERELARALPHQEVQMMLCQRTCLQHKPAT